MTPSPHPRQALGKRGMHVVRASLVMQQCGVILTCVVSRAAAAAAASRASDIPFARARTRCLNAI